MADVKDFFGTTDVNLNLPLGLANYGHDEAGIILFANNIMKVMIYGSLIFALLNLLVSGIQFINSSGNPEYIKTASGRIWISLLGIVVAAGSLVVAGILGLIFFGSASAIINPVIYGP